MNVGELRRALENMSDAQEVVFDDRRRSLGRYQAARSVGTHKLLNLLNGFYCDPKDANLNPHPAPELLRNLD